MANDRNKFLSLAMDTHDRCAIKGTITATDISYISALGVLAQAQALENLTVALLGIAGWQDKK